MGFNIGGSGGGGEVFEYKMVVFTLSLIVLIPTMFTLFVPSYSDTDGEDWSDEIASIQDQYYLNSGKTSTAEQNIWSLTGIYTPYAGQDFGYTDDGWVYGQKITSDSPSQYVGDATFTGKLEVVQADNGLFYYKSHPDNMTGITDVTYDTDGKIITDGATVYSAISFNKSQASNIFFTSSSKTTTDQGYYYAYSGYRYVFQPLSDYFTTVEGSTEKVTANSTSLSLIWYIYSAGTSGIAGQLAISGSDKGVSYLTSTDIIKAFNSNTYSSTFDMTFNSVQMHLVIRLDPSRFSTYSSDAVANCYNNGYWSVMVYSDAVQESMTSTTYEFSASNVFSTLINLLSFNITSQYNIDGWVGIIASAMVTMPLYATLMVMALDKAYLWVIVGILAAIQAITSVGSWFL